MEKNFGVVVIDSSTNKVIGQTRWVASMEEARRICDEYNFDGSKQRAYAVDITPKK